MKNSALNIVQNNPSIDSLDHRVIFLFPHLQDSKNELDGGLQMHCLLVIAVLGGKIVNLDHTHFGIDLTFTVHGDYSSEELIECLEDEFTKVLDETNPRGIRSINIPQVQTFVLRK